jgi:hypothetical protein
VFRKYDVESDNAHLVVIEELVKHRAELVAAPWPTALHCEAFLVNIDDDDSRIHIPRHRQAQARIVDNVFESIDEGNWEVAGCMAGKNKDHHKPKRDAHQVLLQAVSLIVLCAREALLAESAGILGEIPRRVSGGQQLFRV